MSSPKNWKPTETQTAVLKALQAIDYHGGIVDAIRSCGIHHDTYYGWFENPAFCDWWQSRS